MEQETKKCPYCGEEILAVAKKCKHCGEWLEEKEDAVPTQITETAEEHQVDTPAQPTESAEEPPINKLMVVRAVKEAAKVSLKEAKDAVDAADGDFDKAMAILNVEIAPSEKEQIKTTLREASKDTNEDVEDNFSGFAGLCFILALIGAIITFIHQADITYRDVAGGKLRLIVELANGIPEWVGDLASVIADIGLTCLLMKLTKLLGKPMNVLCGLMITYSVVSTLGYFLGLFGFNDTLLLFLLYTIISIVVGIKLMVTYQNHLKPLGLGMILYPIGFYMILAIFIAAAGENYSVNFGVFYFGISLLELAYYLVFASCLIDTYEKPENKASWGRPTIIAVVAFVMMIVVGSCSNSDSDSWGANDNTEVVSDDYYSSDDDYSDANDGAMNSEIEELLDHIEDNLKFAEENWDEQDDQRIGQLVGQSEIGAMMSIEKLETKKNSMNSYQRQRFEQLKSRYEYIFK